MADDEFATVNNETFIQLQNVLIHQIEDEESGTSPIDITRMLAVQLSAIQRTLATKLGETKAK